ncbi:hypothetical protein TDB9533_03857 [Thalassocella blandensis]|nr:hypothetical protein TDB9533_03857 [Thalassocella blandensis]
MNAFVDIIVFLIKSLGSLYVSLVLLRFLLQLVRADFYNQISQAIVKLTNPLLIPIRRVVPSVMGIDVASLILALCLQVLLSEIIILVAAQQLINPLPLVLFGLLGCINLLIYIFYGCGIVLVITSFVAPYSNHPVLNLIRQIMDPMLGPLQRLIPPIGGLDFSILFFFLGLGVLQRILGITASSIGLNPFFVIGF